MAYKLYLSFQAWTTGSPRLNAAVGAGLLTHMRRPPETIYSPLGLGTLVETTDNACATVSPHASYSAYGADGSMLGNNGGNISGGSRTSFLSGGGHQLALRRSTVSIGDEVWFSAELVFASLSSSSFSTPTYNDYIHIFRWGDVSVRYKSSTYDSSRGTHTVVLALYNAASEIDTVTFVTTTTTYCHLRVHVKLDGSTGLIECSVNGIAQTTPYTGQNTVSVISLATATGIFFGPPVFDTGTVLTIHLIGNVYFDDAGWAIGRPVMRMFSLSGETATGWVATGTSVTTIRDALTGESNTSHVANAKAARGTDSGSDVLFDVSTPTTSDMDTDILALQIFGGGAHCRDYAAVRKLGVGFSLSGVHNMDAATAAVTLIHATTTTPPTSTGNKFFAEFLFKTGSTPYVKSEMASIKPRLLVV